MSPERSILLRAATGILRPITQQSRSRLLLLMLFWVLAGPALMGISSHGLRSAFYEFCEFLKRFVLDEGGFAPLLCLLAGIGLGGVHYIVLRSLPTQSKERLRIREIVGTVTVVILLAALPGFFLVQHVREKRLQMACYQFGLDDELRAMGSRGDYRGAVRRMEEACDTFQDAKVKLGGRYVRPNSPTGVSGMNYLYTTLVAGNEDWFMTNLSSTLASYFCNTSDPSIGYVTPPPKAWKPVAKQMTTSKMPILRTIGYWLLDDREGFATEVYAQVDGGDASFGKLEYIAACGDSLVHRGFHRLVEHAKRNGFSDEGSRWYRQACYYFHMLGPKALASGKASAEDLEYARGFALKYSNRVDSYKAFPDRAGIKWEREFLGLSSEDGQ